MTPWRWVSQDVVYAIHDRQLAEHGGGDGVRDGGTVDSALARPQNLAAYGAPDALLWPPTPMDWPEIMASSTETNVRPG